MTNTKLVGSLDVEKRANSTGGDLTVAGSFSVADVSFTDKLDAVAVAPAFDAESTYAVDDVVSHNGRLYKCSTAVATEAAWVATDWTEITLIDLITGV